MKKIAVIGGGASSLAFAAELSFSKKDFSLTVFEKNDRVGKKLLATGNGRCNIFNRIDRRYIVGEKTDLSKTDAEGSSEEFFLMLGLPVYSDDEGRCYPVSNKAASVLDCLRFRLDDQRMKLFTGKEITHVKVLKEGFLIENEFFDFLVVAVGGKAQVRNYNGEELADSLGHRFTETAPALVKLKVDDPFFKGLDGVRCRAELTLISGGKRIIKEIGEVQFSSEGISGICAMQVSLNASFLLSQGRGSSIEIRLLPELDYSDVIKCLFLSRDARPSAPAEQLLTGILDRKLAVSVIKKCGIALGRTVGSISDEEIHLIAKSIKHLSFDIKSTGNFSEAQVMLGGVEFKDLNTATMESKIHSNLYFCGEVLDIAGYCGGYNLNWAWTTGRIAAQDILRKI